MRCYLMQIVCFFVSSPCNTACTILLSALAFSSFNISALFSFISTSSLPDSFALLFLSYLMTLSLYFRCWPPPVFILTISVLETSVFLYYWIIRYLLILHSFEVDLAENEAPLRFSFILASLQFLLQPF
jgi:hypothetical protein